MGDKKLATHVAVHSKGETTIFGPDDDLPGWAAKLITNPSAWVPETGGDPDHQPEHSEPSSDPGGAGGGSHEPPPPLSGPGSSAEAWLIYASNHGVQLADGTPRDEIVRVLTERGMPTTVSA